jgi:malonyl CoA-acyl carrier protein transacylase
MRASLMQDAVSGQEDGEMMAVSGVSTDEAVAAACAEAAQGRVRRGGELQRRRRW